MEEQEKCHECNGTGVWVYCDDPYVARPCTCQMTEEQVQKVFGEPVI